MSTKFTFANSNVIVVNGYKIGNAFPANVPSLKTAAQIALDEVNRGTTPNSFVKDAVQSDSFKTLYFENEAVLTIPSEFNVVGYKQALQILIAEIED